MDNPIDDLTESVNLREPWLEDLLEPTDNYNVVCASYNSCVCSLANMMFSCATFVTRALEMIFISVENA